MIPAPIELSKPTLCLYEGKPYVKVEANLISYYKEDTSIDVKKFEPNLEWKGADIPLHLIRQCFSFFKDINTRDKAEAQVRLFYNMNTNEWAAWAFAQECVGLTTSELKEHPTIASDRAQFGNEWIPFGTIHSHCNVSAFQSGTDHADEARQDGIHITIGKLDSPAFETHARFSCAGIIYNISLIDFVEFDAIPAIENLSAPTQQKIYDAILHEPLWVKYPQNWKDNVVQKVYKAQSYSYPAFNHKRVVTKYPKTTKTAASKRAECEDRFKAYSQEELDLYLQGEKTVYATCDKYKIFEVEDVFDYLNGEIYYLEGAPNVLHDSLAQTMGDNPVMTMLDLIDMLELYLLQKEEDIDKLNDEIDKETTRALETNELYNNGYYGT